MAQERVNGAMRNTIISLLLCVIGVTHAVTYGADKQLIAADLRLKLLQQLKQGDNPTPLIKQYNLDGMPEVFSLIGPRVIQNIVVDYLHDGKKEFILEDCRSAVAKKYKEDKKFLAEFLKKHEGKHLGTEKLKCLCADYFYHSYPGRLDLSKRLPLLISSMWDEKKQKLVEIREIFARDKIDHLIFVNYEKFLRFNPLTPSAQFELYKDNVDALYVGYDGDNKESLAYTCWDLQTGLMIDYGLRKNCEKEPFPSSYDEDFSTTISQNKMLTLITASTVGQTKVKVMLQDDVKDLNCAILATMLNQRQKR